MVETSSLLNPDQSSELFLLCPVHLRQLFFHFHGFHPHSAIRADPDRPDSTRGLPIKGDNELRLDNCRFQSHPNSSPPSDPVEPLSIQARMAASGTRTRVTRPVSSSSNNGVLRARPVALGLAKVLFMSLFSAVKVKAAPILSILEHYHDDLPEEEGASLWVLYVTAIVLVLLGGAFAGLTIAYVVTYLPTPLHHSSPQCGSMYEIG